MHNLAEHNDRIHLAGTGILLLIYFGLLFVIWSANHGFSFSQVSNVPVLTAEAIVDPEAMGKTFQIEAKIVAVIHSREGLKIIKARDQKHNLYIDIPIFPSLGMTPNHENGQLVKVVGNLSRYKNTWQLKPLSKKHIQIISSSDRTPFESRSNTSSTTKLNPVSLQDALTMKKGGQVLVGPVQVVTASIFKSAAGKEHLKFQFRSGDTYVEGIRYQGDWEKADLDRVGSEFLIWGEVSMFKGKPSLVVKSFQSIKQ